MFTVMIEASGTIKKTDFYAIQLALQDNTYLPLMTL
jgi:hypothetical protein